MDTVEVVKHFKIIYGVHSNAEHINHSGLIAARGLVAVHVSHKFDRSIVEVTKNCNSSSICHKLSALSLVE